MKLYAANGVNTDLETALYMADHHPGADAVERARHAVGSGRARSATTCSAWSLHTAGNDDAAWPEVRKALALGSRDPQLRYHAAAIRVPPRRCAARRGPTSVVLDGNRWFSPIATPHIDVLATKLGLS